MSTKYPQGLITPTPPFKSTTAKSFSGVWTLEQLAKNFYYYTQAVPKSLRFRSSASAYLNRTPSTGGNQQTWTWSGWVKRGTLGTRQQMFCQGNQTTTYPSTIVEFASTDKLSIVAYSGSFGMQLETTAVYRDPSSWYHIVVAVDTTQGSSTERVKAYVNGVQVTSFSTATYPSQNYLTGANATVAANIGRDTSGALYLDGYMAEINFIDGQALDPSYFGQVSPITGVWSPAKYVGSYGTNGFYLKFSDTTSTTTLCYDYSGNGNNWTPNNISLTSGSTYDSMLDSPTNYDNGGNGVGNYAVLNPLNKGANSTLNSANLNFRASSSAGVIYQAQITGTFSVTSGKWYWEVIPTDSATNGIVVGIAQSTRSMSSNPFVAGAGAIYVYIGTNGNKSNGSTETAYGASYTNSDVIGVAFDADAGTLTFYKNNTSQGTAFTGISGSYMPYLVNYASNEDTTGNFNFGQRPFAYTPPSGYKALNTQNLPAASIVNGASFMAATLYTGNGSTQNVINAVNGVSFQPDFVWVKDRTNVSSNDVFDSVRGATKWLYTNGTAAEGTYSGVTAFNSNGFSLGSAGGDNASGDNFVGWQWKAGGTAVTNNAGSITSQVSANTTAGFSVVTYGGNSTNGASVGHGLGKTPSMIIVKNRSASYDWPVWNAILPAGGNQLYLNLTAAADATSLSSIGSSTFALNTWAGVNASGNNYVAYCFAAIPGYSAFGSYTGNGSSVGPFVYCGFLPRFILIKSTTANRDWIIWDTARNPYNIGTAGVLFPDTSGAEYSGGGAYAIAVVSNGFYLPVSTVNLNANGETMIYACFAENPFKYSLAR